MKDHFSSSSSRSSSNCMKKTLVGKKLVKRGHEEEDEKKCIVFLQYKHAWFYTIQVLALQKRTNNLIRIQMPYELVPWEKRRNLLLCPTNDICDSLRGPKNEVEANYQLLFIIQPTAWQAHYAKETWVFKYLKKASSRENAKSTKCPEKQMFIV